jgi:hypothetical protein
MLATYSSPAMLIFSIAFRLPCHCRRHAAIAPIFIFTLRHFLRRQLIIFAIADFRFSLFSFDYFFIHACCHLILIITLRAIPPAISTPYCLPILLLIFRLSCHAAAAPARHAALMSLAAIFIATLIDAD